MNIIDSEMPVLLTAKTCGCKEQENTRRVTYSFIDSYHGLCHDKKDIIQAELEACRKLLKYTIDTLDKKIIEREVEELKMTLDLLS
jgi:hypothetical protein